MKLRNKQNPNKFGKILTYDAGKDGGISVKTDEGVVWFYHSLAKLNEEWEDYEEPKEFWYIECDGEVYSIERLIGYVSNKLKEIGNYFETREESELAVRKLEAWKMIKDMGFKIEGIRYINHKRYIEWSIPQKVRDDHFASEAFNGALHLIFGGEE